MTFNPSENIDCLDHRISFTNMITVDMGASIVENGELRLSRVEQSFLRRETNDNNPSIDVGVYSLWIRSPNHIQTILYMRGKTDLIASRNLHLYIDQKEVNVTPGSTISFIPSKESWTMVLDTSSVEFNELGPYGYCLIEGNCKSFEGISGAENSTINYTHLDDSYSNTVATMKTTAS